MYAKQSKARKQYIDLYSYARLIRETKDLTAQPSNALRTWITALLDSMSGSNVQRTAASINHTIEMMIHKPKYLF
jgi:hypothetical protein